MAYMYSWPRQTAGSSRSIRLAFCITSRVRPWLESVVGWRHPIDLSEALPRSKGVSTLGGSTRRVPRPSPRCPSCHLSWGHSAQEGQYPSFPVSDSVNMSTGHTRESRRQLSEHRGLVESAVARACVPQYRGRIGLYPLLVNACIKSARTSQGR